MLLTHIDRVKNVCYVYVRKAVAREAIVVYIAHIRQSRNGRYNVRKRIIVLIMKPPEKPELQQCGLGARKRSKLIYVEIENRHFHV